MPRSLSATLASSSSSSSSSPLPSSPFSLNKQVANRFYHPEKYLFASSKYMKF